MPNLIGPQRRRRQVKTPGIEALDFDTLVEMGRKVGFPPFCNGWPLETLIKKLKGLENS